MCRLFLLTVLTWPDLIIGLNRQFDQGVQATKIILTNISSSSHQASKHHHYSWSSLPHSPSDTLARRGRSCSDIGVLITITSTWWRLGGRWGGNCKIMTRSDWYSDWLPSPLLLPAKLSISPGIVSLLAHLRGTGKLLTKRSNTPHNYIMLFKNIETAWRGLLVVDEDLGLSNCN